MVTNRPPWLKKFAILSGCVLLAYLPFFVASEERMARLTRENGFYETLTALAFLLAAIGFARTWWIERRGNAWWKIRTRRNVFSLLLALLFIVGAGEELSWGQHMLGFESTPYFAEHNRQGELNIHNLPFLHGREEDGTPKTGIASLVTGDRLFSLFWFGYCFCLPLLYAASRKVRDFLQGVNLPIVPLWIGLAFPLTYAVSKAVVPLAGTINHYVVEVKESMFAVLFLVFAAHFLLRIRAGRRERLSGAAPAEAGGGASP